VSPSSDRYKVCAALLAILAVPASLAAAAQKPAARQQPQAARVSYEKQVQPLLKARCYACHGNGSRLGNFEIDSREGILTGGNTHPVVVPGASARSHLIKLVSGQVPGKVMPPKGARLKPNEVALLKAWIDQGLSFGSAGTAAAWRPPLAPRPVKVPDAPPGSGLTNPIDRFVAAYLRRNSSLNPHPSSLKTSSFKTVDDRTYARRLYLDIIGLLPTPYDLSAFESDPAPDKRARLARKLLDDEQGYAEHWLSFWNDALRNDYIGTGYIDGGRIQITYWLYNALTTNMPYDRFVTELVSPTRDSGGFIKGIVWRGVVNASQRPEMQGAQSVSQVFMGVNLKCASCHDSFINNWKLSDAYGMAAIFADGQLETYRCDRPTGQYAPLRFLYPELGSIDASAPRPKRLEQLAASLTSPRNGRLARTMVNRIWGRLMGRGLVEPADDMDQRPWDPDLLDWLACEFAGVPSPAPRVSGPPDSGLGTRDLGRWDVKRLIELIVTSRAYQMPSVGLPKEDVKDFRFVGPVVRRMSAEQFADAVSQLTGVWSRPAEQFRFTREGGVVLPRRSVVRYKSEVMRSGSQELDVEIAGSEVLSLVVSDGGNGRSSDWADWVNPRLVSADGQEIRLSEIPWRSATTGYGAVERNRSIVQKPLRLGDRTFENGIGTHANSIITYFLPKGVTRFRATIGPDSGALEAPGAQTSVQFYVVTGDRSIMEARAALSVSDPLTRALGRPNREQVVTQRSTVATTLQALELTNGQTLATALSEGGQKWVGDWQSGKVGERGKPVTLVDALYTQALGRLPSPTERAAAVELLGAEPTREGIEDLLWAVVMLPEFQLY